MKNTEIERKFKVDPEWIHTVDVDAVYSYNIKQGYLSTDPKRTVRVRTDDCYGWITIKGEGDESGMSRFEWEMAIPLNEAEELFKLCDNVIVKRRHEVEYKLHVWEIDVFGGENEGLTLAEVELTDMFEHVDIPDWIGEEVTGLPWYYNSYLSKNPYATWGTKRVSPPL